MPFSLGRSYKKLPTANVDGHIGRIGKARGTKGAAGGPTEFRRTRYRLIFPIGCGLGLGVWALLLIAPGFVQLPPVPTTAPMHVDAFSTPAMEARPQAQATASAEGPPSSTPTSAPLPTPSPMFTLPGSSANPWAGEIPEAACIPADLPQTGRVVEVLDGDTIRVLLDSDGRVYSVRYLGVEAPRVAGGTLVLGRQAVSRNSELVYQKQVVMVRDITDSDANGRLLRYVLVDGVFANHALIQDGLARLEMMAPDTACLNTLLAAEQQARSQGLGIWSSVPTPESMP